ncbi:acyl-CoA dehydrogenase family protein [Phenylobacterium sp. LH3H17]|uniref:acyl-CoA dehydrogenase family protein n=1 Tax=Phenylobacterium sp. LH3H17 TaxID=2903901 RepID=UPI0020C9ED0C|nr:acyl-CoA dehydrogenase family protein [Phenylobacterium sp. LH3H17]UTP40158.1 acyl-CoA dehydrogenase family protein [Phenylobacterium sp. LH3H17]
MHVAWSPEDLAFRDEVRAFLDAELTPAMRHETRLMTSVYAPHELSVAWQAILHARGWAAPAWPVEYGGCGWSAAQRYIFASELAAAGAPPLSPMGIGMCGPVLIGHGSPEQKAHYLPRMLTGEHQWCQGYSEPGSGSDLASLQMAAVDDSDHFVCTGHKLWTTHANVANWIFCLVRTSQERIPQQGITFLLIDMAAPGIEVRPILMLSGEHIQNDVFFTDVRVPKANVVGKVGEGWTVAKYLMEFERGGGVSTPGLKARLDRIREMAAKEGVLAAPGFASRLAQLSIEIDALAAVELQILSNLSQGDAPGAKSSMMKTVGTELSQRLTELALEAAGDYAAAYQPHATRPGGPTPNYRPPADQGHVGPDHSLTVAAKYLNDRAGSIYAGTNEIQRNIMAKAVLGL